MNEILKEIIQYNKIIVIRHSSPDYDAYGAQIGLALALKNKFKDKTIYMDGDESPSNVLNIKMDKLTKEDYKKALVIICDTACQNMLFDDNYKYASKVCVIDHHENTPDIKGTYLIKSEYSSASEVVAEFLYDNAILVTKEAANALFIGIVGDTNRFLYKGTSENTFSIASKLVESGANLIDCYKLMEKEETINEKRMKGYILSNFLVKDKVAYIYISKNVINDFQVNVNFSSRGCINLLSSILGIEAFVGFTEAINDEIYVEIRSKRISLVNVAKEYGGGGHALACGITLKAGFEYTRIIDRINEVIENESL